MPIRFLILSLCLSICTFTPVRAQPAIEAGIYIGGTNYLGDLAEQVALQETHPAYGVFLRWNPAKMIGIKTSLLAGRLSGNDANSLILYRRAFKFSMPFWSTNLQLEILPFAKRRYLSPFDFKRGVEPYLALGVGYTAANDKLDYSNSPIEAIQIPFPEPNNQVTFFNSSFGAGLRFEIWEYWSISLEGAWWYVYSDYLDGVSINGRSTRNDWYLTAGLMVSHHFGGRTICPTF
ncbi:MAG: hypothetical protein KDC34_17620 [Saprospiraceae bacterium]|nr:hypothetical protein [Saprospiraceae bacterium]